MIYIASLHQAVYCISSCLRTSAQADAGYGRTFNLPVFANRPSLNFTGRAPTPDCISVKSVLLPRNSTCGPVDSDHTTLVLRLPAETIHPPEAGGRHLAPDSAPLRSPRRAQTRLPLATRTEAALPLAGYPQVFGHLQCCAFYTDGPDEASITERFR